MKSRKIGVAILLSIFISIFSGFTLIQAAVNPNNVSKAAASTDKTEKNIEQIKEKTKGIPIISKIIGIAEKVTKKIEKEIKFSEIASLLGIKDGAVKTYLDKFVIKTPVVEAVADGMNINGTITVNNNPLTAFLEIGKVGAQRKKVAADKNKADTKTKTAADKKTGEKSEIASVGGGWYVIFYIKSPKKWKLSDYFPDTFDLKKIFPKLNLDMLSPKGKPLTPDLFELEDSYFYISTTDIPDHEKIDDVYQGVGFKGRLRFIGLFNILDKIFGLKSQPIEATGKIKIPNFEGSEFTIKIPTEATIIPEYLQLGSKKVKFIPGFKVTLAPHELGITFVLGIPIIKASGGIKVNLPFVKETLEFYSGIDFSGTRLKLYGGQKTKVEDVFGIKGFHASGFKAGLVWDFIVSGQLAVELGAATAGIGLLVGLLPVGVIFEGGLQSGKSKLDVKVDMSVHGTKGIDFSYDSKGSLFTQDFAKFWLDFIVKNSKATTEFMKIVPPFVFENVDINATWSEDKDKKFELGVGKVELIPGVPASMTLSVSEKGITGKGSIASLFLPDKNNPIIELTSKDDRKKGPSFDVSATISPVNISLKGDGRVYAKNLGLFGELNSATKIDVSDNGIELDSETKVLDFDTKLKLIGKLNGKLEDWKAQGSFTQKSTEKISQLLKTSSTALLKASEDLKSTKEKLIKENNTFKDKAIADIETAKTKAVSDIKTYFNSLEKGTEWRINEINKEIVSWKTACSKKPNIFPIFEQNWCNLFQVTSREISVAALKVHKDVTLKVVSGVAQLGTQAALSIGQVFTQVGLDTKKNFESVGLAIGEAFTKVTGEVAKMINEIIIKQFIVHSLTFDAQFADLKKLKAPAVELDATIFGKRPKNTLKMQLDFKKPDEFIKNLADYVVKDWLGLVDEKVDATVKQVKSKVKSAEELANKKIKEAEQKAKQEADAAKKKAK